MFVSLGILFRTWYTLCSLVSVQCSVELILQCIIIIIGRIREASEAMQCAMLASTLKLCFPSSPLFPSPVAVLLLVVLACNIQSRTEVAISNLKIYTFGCGEGDFIVSLLMQIGLKKS